MTRIFECYIWDEKKKTLVLNRSHWSKVSEVQSRVMGIARLNHAVIRRFDLIHGGNTVKIQVEDSGTAAYIESIFDATPIDDKGISHEMIYTFDLDAAESFMLKEHNSKFFTDQAKERIERTKRLEEENHKETLKRKTAQTSKPKGKKKKK